MVVGTKTKTPLGVIVDTSFDFEDDFLSGKLQDDELMSLPDMDDKSLVMKNGKVKRRLKWKPKRFLKKKNHVSSNMSVVSALTNRSASTNKSISTHLSVTTYFSKSSRKSRKSQESFHTFHSTETPVKNNKKGPKLHYTRPNYSDTFATKPKKEGRGPNENCMSTISEVHVGDDIERLQKVKLSSSAREPPPLTFLDSHEISSIAIKKPQSSSQKVKRPPLFKRKSRKNIERKKQEMSATMSALSEMDAIPSAISLGRATTMLPTIEAYEDDRRIGIATRRNERADTANAVKSEKASGHQPTTRSSVECPNSTKGRMQSHSKSPSPSMRRYNRPKDSTMTTTNGALVMDGGEEGTEIQNIEQEKSDLDKREFIEAENNLRAIHEMAAEHLAHGEYEEATEVFEEILRGQKERYGENHYRVGTALHNLAVAHLKNENVDKAIECFDQAVEVRKEALVPDHPDVALSLGQLGVAYMEANRFEKALVAFREALHIRRNICGPKHIKCSKLLNNIGCALYAEDNLEESCATFTEALDIYRFSLQKISTRASNTSSNSLMLSMASTLSNISSIELRNGQFDNSEVALEEALMLQQSVLPEDHPVVMGTIENLDFVQRTRDGIFPSVLSGWAKTNQTDTVIGATQAAIGSALDFTVFECGTKLHRLVSDVRPVCAISSDGGSSSSSDSCEDYEDSIIACSFSL